MTHSDVRNSGCEVCGMPANASGLCLRCLLSAEAFRHRWALSLLQAGYTAQTIQQILGWQR